jgi:NADH-quinone oxidoreductase subunit J
MTIYDFMFYLFAALTIVSAFCVVTIRNIVYSAFFLLFTFFGVVGLYILLAADFIAIVQLVVYVGGILILLLFGVMLTNKITSVQVKSGTFQILPAAIAVGLFAGILTAALVNTKWKTFETGMPATTAYSLGHLLMNEYVLVFELLGVILLVVLIGAASMARRNK